MPGQDFITYDIPLRNSDKSNCFILRVKALIRFATKVMVITITITTIERFSIDNFVGERIPTINCSVCKYVGETIVVKQTLFNLKQCPLVTPTLPNKKNSAGLIMVMSIQSLRLLGSLRGSLGIHMAW